MRTSFFIVIGVLLAAVFSHGAEQIPPHRARQIAEACPEKPTVMPRRPRRVLIWHTPAHLMEKDPHKGYCIPYGSVAFESLGRKTGAYEPVISDDLAVFLPDNLRRFDAMILNNASGPWIAPTDADLVREEFRKTGADKAGVEQILRRSLLDWASDGGGVVVIHYAIAANRHWPEFRELVGATFTGHPWNEEIGVRIDAPGDPLVAAYEGRSFRIADEIYEYGPPYDRSRLRVLMSLDTQATNMNVKWITRKDGDFALAWVKTWGKGRIFNTSFGHRTELYWDRRLLRFYLDGIQFACGDLDSPAEPKGTGR